MSGTGRADLGLLGLEVDARGCWLLGVEPSQRFGGDPEAVVLSAPVGPITEKGRR